MSGILGAIEQYTAAAAAVARLHSRGCSHAAIKEAIRKRKEKRAAMIAQLEAARLRGDAQAEVIETPCIRCGMKVFAWPQHKDSSVCFECTADGEAQAEQQAVAWYIEQPTGANSVVLSSALSGEDRAELASEGTRIRPLVYGDAAASEGAVQSLIERWRPHGRVPLCELEAALSSTATPAPVAGEAVAALVGEWSKRATKETTAKSARWYCNQLRAALAQDRASKSALRTGGGAA